jgi:hypothetical protein
MDAEVRAERVFAEVDVDPFEGGGRRSLAPSEDISGMVGTPNSI